MAAASDLSAARAAAKSAARVIDRNVDAITLREDLSAEELKTMGVTKPKVYVTADPALLLEAGSEGAVDGFLLGNNIDPAGRYALFVLREWQGFAAKKQAFVQSAKYVKDAYGLTPIFFALEPGQRPSAQPGGCAGTAVRVPRCFPRRRTRS